MIVAVHHQDLGVLGVLWCRGMNVQFSETPAKGDVLLLGDRLIPEEEHQMRCERASERFDDVWLESFG